MTKFRFPFLARYVLWLFAGALGLVTLGLFASLWMMPRPTSPRTLGMAGAGPVCATQFLSPFPGLPLSTIPSAGSPSPPAAGGSLGQHIVQRGEALYCIGRAYGVSPSAIGRANGLVYPFRLTPGQVLTIPAVRWGFTPPGPVCHAQFPSPFTDLPTATSTTTPPNLPPQTFTPTRSGPTKTPIPTRDVATKTPVP